MTFNGPKFLYVLLYAAVVIIILSCVDVKPVVASLDASAELGYINYDAKINDGTHLSGSSLTQRYSLMYHTRDNIISNRLGTYDISLGYNWATFDTTVKSSAGGHEDISAARGNILFRGEVNINPKEAPFKLHIYSADMSAPVFSTARSFLNETRFSGGRASQFSEPGLISNIQDGLHVETGANLVMGVKNGMTNGYNEFLRHFPMVLVDYKDIINRDLKSGTPVDNRLSRLAFVSLNKKDNWFHYRLTNYSDYVAPENNYRETQFQLGTVDHMLERRWIDFTNWLSISVDGQLTKKVNTTIGEQSYTEFDFNLFGVARRSQWEMMSFNNFNRHRDDSSGVITYKTSIPVFVSGVLSPDTSWNTRVTYNTIRDTKAGDFQTISTSVRLDTFKRSLFTFSQQFAVDSTNAEAGQSMFTLSGGLETTSTARFSRSVSLGASYYISSATSSDKSIEANHTDQTLRLNMGYTPRQDLRISLTSQNRVSSGKNIYISSSATDANAQTPQFYNPRNTTEGNFYQTVNTLMATWNPTARLTFDISNSFDAYMPEQGAGSSIYSFRVQSSYTSDKYKLNSTTTFVSDDSINNTLNQSIAHDTSLSYNFSKNLDSNFNVVYQKGISGDNKTSNLFLTEQLNYNIYKVNGVVRKLAEFHQIAKYTDTQAGVSILSSKKEATLSLGTKYYPVKQLSLGTGATYKFYSNNVNSYELTYYGQAALSFKLFQASIDYSTSRRKSDGLLDKRLTANFKKSF